MHGSEYVMYKKLVDEVLFFLIFIFSVANVGTKQTISKYIVPAKFNFLNNILDMCFKLCY